MVIRFLFNQKRWQRRTQNGFWIDIDPEMAVSLSRLPRLTEIEILTQAFYIYPV